MRSGLVLFIKIIMKNSLCQFQMFIQGNKGNAAWVLKMKKGGRAPAAIDHGEADGTLIILANGQGHVVPGLIPEQRLQQERVRTCGSPNPGSAPLEMPMLLPSAGKDVSGLSCKGDMSLNFGTPRHVMMEGGRSCRGSGSGSGD